MDRYDVAIVGAGIVGLATAYELTRRYGGVSVAVLEREASVGEHQTGHNSGVIHSGVYYAPGSLKARLCVEGSRELYDFCAEHGIPHERCGKLIVARSPDELPRLAELERRGRANGVPGLRRLEGPQLTQVEPEATGIAALHCPGTGIVDFRRVAQTLEQLLRRAGVTFLLSTEVRSVAGEGAAAVVHHSRGALRARRVVACAGLWSDRLARRSGAPTDPRIVPFRGAYLRVVGPEASLVRGMIYPVPDPELPFLGVHITRHIDGNLLLGPSALLVGSRDAYRLRRVRQRDLAETAAWPGTWRVARRFVEACAQYMPALSGATVERAAVAGVRAQAVSRAGKLEDDFVVSPTAHGLHVRNAPSPAATSSLALGRLIVDRLGPVRS